MGGVNQQERLSQPERFKWFLAGFIEGEGSLTVSIKHHESSRFGFYVDPEFLLTQHESGAKLLEMTRKFFRSGRISPKSGSPKVLVYSITSRQTLTTTVVPFFEKYVLPYSCKAEAFYRFREILEMMNRKEHHLAQGLCRIVEKAYQMNPYSKGSGRLRTIEEVRDRILRDYTPDTDGDVGEDIVQSS